VGLALAAWFLVSGVLAQEIQPRQLSFGRSSEGRPLHAYWLGNGPVAVLVVGGIHGRPEVNASALVWQLLDYFAEDTAALPAGLRLLFVPEANPDGMADGTRELADGVDPNRNFPTSDWRPGTYGPGKWLPDGGGERPLSEPETTALARLVGFTRPVAVLSYHSAAGIAMGGFTSEESGLLATYSDSSGYPARPFVAYPVTGDFAQWCDEIGIPTVEVELTNHFDPELDRNLAGIGAVLRLISSLAGDDPSY
jgi:protein MpaA